MNESKYLHLTPTTKTSNIKFGISGQVQVCSRWSVMKLLSLVHYCHYSKGHWSVICTRKIIWSKDEIKNSEPKSLIFKYFCEWGKGCYILKGNFEIYMMYGTESILDSVLDFKKSSYLIQHQIFCSVDTFDSVKKNLNHQNKFIFVEEIILD